MGSCSKGSFKRGLRGGPAPQTFVTTKRTVFSTNAQSRFAKAGTSFCSATYLTVRAWDKGPTAEVESSHGRFNPT